MLTSDSGYLEVAHLRVGAGVTGIAETGLA